MTSLSSAHLDYQSCPLFNVVGLVFYCLTGRITFDIYYIFRIISVTSGLYFIVLIRTIWISIILQTT